MGSKSLFNWETVVEASLKDTFAWYENPGTFQRLSPPFAPVSVKGFPSLKTDDSFCLQLKVMGLSLKWLAKIHDYQKERGFSDLQVKGPFNFWLHKHLFKALNDQTTKVEDLIEYKLPLASLGKRFLSSYTQKQLEKLFRYREQVQQRDLPLFSSHAPRKCFLLTGASGLIGSELRVFLLSQGHEVRTLAYSPQAKEGCWSLGQKLLEEKYFEGVDAVIHLAGEGIANKRWSEKQKKRIADSRILGTQLFARSLKALSSPPPLLITASACGYYQPGSDPLDEKAPPGKGFLAEVCQEWEGATRDIKDKLRCLHLRFGVVIDPRGGALKQMLFPFRMGMGGPLGSGEQMMSWISTEDVIKGIYHLIFKSEQEGAFNFVSPHALSQKDFAKTLAKALKRPYGLPMPSFMVKLLFGEMGTSLLLASQHILPSRLIDSGYRFIHPRLEELFEEVL